MVTPMESSSERAAFFSHVPRADTIRHLRSVVAILRIHATVSREDAASAGITFRESHLLISFNHGYCKCQISIALPFGGPQS